MEDAVSIVENFLEIQSSGSFWLNNLPTPSTNGATAKQSNRQPKVMHDKEICHFFGVYDGHNGPYAAHHCRGRLHENLKAIYTDLCGDLDHKAAPISVGATTDGEFLSTGMAHPGRISSNGIDSKLENVSDERDVFRETFRVTDNQFSEYHCAERVGTSALATLVGTRHITVGSCGDSRAVMYRDGHAMQLSKDHRLDVEQEKARIESSGGKVTYWNGPRVMGVLAMSRAIGDLCFRPYGVICDPEVVSTARSVEDEYLLLATDGLWDVLTNEEAYRIIRHATSATRSQGSELAECIQSAANRLTRIALDRGSRDNITVVLLDLQSDDVGHS